MQNKIYHEGFEVMKGKYFEDFRQKQGFLRLLVAHTNCRRQRTF